MTRLPAVDTVRIVPDPRAAMCRATAMAVIKLVRTKASIGCMTSSKVRSARGVPCMCGNDTAFKAMSIPPASAATVSACSATARSFVHPARTSFFTGRAEFDAVEDTLRRAYGGLGAQPFVLVLEVALMLGGALACDLFGPPVIGTNLSSNLARGIPRNERHPVSSQRAEATPPIRHLTTRRLRQDSRLVSPRAVGSIWA
jgi:hypothetical protein